MLVEITPKTIKSIKNPGFASYASIYLDIYEHFWESVRSAGLEVDPHDDTEDTNAKIYRLFEKGATVRNDRRSVVINRLSGACDVCQTGLGSATLFLSLKCHRNCFYCFNPNQEDYQFYLTNQRDCIKELAQISANGGRLDHIGLTGGEPLLEKEKVAEIFRYAHEKFPQAYTRLYTSGDFVDESILSELQAAHLDEIRFSYRVFDSEQARRHTLDRIAMARDYVPTVLVEMPVLPGTLDEMQQLLLELDQLGIFGINLLELCFPLTNAQAFRENGYRIKNRPYRVLYNYSYAGGLPVAKSESECLDLIEFATDHQLRLGVHYCSLENKHSGEIYQQHFDRELQKRFYFSSRDYFLKSAKVFGSDISKTLRVFETNGYKGYQANPDHHYLEFHVDQIKNLEKLELEVGVATSVMENRSDGEYLRELRVDLTTPKTFDPETDL